MVIHLILLLDDLLLLYRWVCTCLVCVIIGLIPKLMHLLLWPDSAFYCLCANWNCFKLLTVVVPAF